VPTSQRPVDDDARRRALARKLGLSVPPGRGSGETKAVQASTPATREAAGEELKRRYEQHVSDLKRRQAEHYEQSADTALASKNLISATNALRIAVSLLPSDERLKKRLEDLQNQTAASLAQTYLDQAQYEEREGRFADAARSFEKAAKGRPGPKLFERIAHSLLSARGDLKVAAEWAKKAVAQSPDDATYHVTLARIYLEAGLKQSALAEFERAATLAPRDDTIKDWLKKVRQDSA
jgi:tetratricopeptide (TPR) repeat protein